MDREKGLTYRDAGVDIDTQDEALRRIKDALRATRTPGVLADLGAFGGLFALNLSGMAQPVLVASADGVGTKLEVALLAGIHDTVGADLVNHCVNDILVQGARPLFFLDYFATGRLEPAVLAEVVGGIARGCRENLCALLGGETAEMPGFYGEGRYDLAGFIVGIVDRPRVLDGSAVRAGDVLVGLPSAGLHTNGYSLARKLFFEVAGLTIDGRVEALGSSVAGLLLAEHRSYRKVLAFALQADLVSALAHITGGGLTDNIPRVLPEGTAAEIRPGSWPVPPLFRWMQETGKIEDAEMRRTFNLGIGMVAIVPEAKLQAFEAHLDACREPHWRIGRIVPGDRKVVYV
jgi:phosphoribosylformylglycinamidine cyclo-ligase